MSIFSTKNISILNEAYYGKKPEFAKIEKLLEIIIQRCYNIRDGGDDIKINNSKELKEIESLFKKAFGMGEMHITFYTYSLMMGTAGVNAFTMSSFLSYFKEKRNGKERIDDDLVCNVWVDTRLVTECKLTPGEVMAVILHELGHCYNASLFALLAKIPLGLRLFRGPNGYFIEVDPLSAIQSIISRILYNEIIGLPKLLNEADKQIQILIEKNKYIARFITNAIRIINNFSGLKRIFTIYSPYQFSIVGLYYSLQSKSIFGYSDEKFADSFATAYGYGKETISVQHKFQQQEYNVVKNVGEKIPILNIGIDFVKTVNMISIVPMDPHPDYAIRMQSQLNKLKRDLKDPNLDPKVKKELLANIKEMEDYVNDVVFSTEENLKKGRVFSLLYNHVMMKVFNGKADIREIFEIVYNHEM